MSIYLQKLSLFLVIAALFAAAFSIVRAHELDISFPISELGGCESKESCKTYCDLPQNVEACIAFAEAHGLVKPEESRAARRVLAETGPGGCQTPDECRAYCESAANGEECVEFAAEHGLIPPEKVELVRKVVRDGGPGGCRTETECKSYCDNPAHGEECLVFAEANGLVDPEEARIARVVLTKGGPGGCFNEESCKAYCNEPGNTEECVAFAVDNGFMSAEEARRALAGGGAGPGGCRGEDECEAYCENPDNTGECVEFGVEHGFISPEEAALALKVARQGGPGGCRSEKECRTYCEESGNEEECFNFGVENGLIPPEEADRARAMIGRDGPGGCRGKQCRDFCENLDNADACLEFALQNGLIPPEEADRARRGLEVIRQGGPGGCRGPQACEAYCADANNEDECFDFASEHGFIEEEHREQFRKFKEKEGEIVKIVEERGGPGGCRSKRECMEYCMNPTNEAECNLFAASHGFMPPPSPQIRPDELRKFAAPTIQGDFEGPGGCKGPRECFEFCSQNKEQCRGFRPPDFDRPPERREGRTFERLEASGKTGPGGCRNPDECLRFCAKPENKFQCVQFKREHGAEVPQDFLENPERLREFRPEEHRFPLDKPPGFRNAPGGCGSPVECFQFCSDPSNAEKCGAFQPPPAFQPGFKEGEFERPRIGAPPEFEFEDDFEGEFEHEFEQEFDEGRFRREFELRREFEGRFDQQEPQFFPPAQEPRRQGEFIEPLPQDRRGEVIERPRLQGEPEFQFRREETRFHEERRSFEDQPRFEEPRFDDQRFDEPVFEEPRFEEPQVREEERFSPPSQNFTAPAPPPEFRGQGVLNYKGPRSCRSVSDCLTVCAVSGSITECRVMFRHYAFTRL